jgi:hypothetical protein
VLDEEEEEDGEHQSEREGEGLGDRLDGFGLHRRPNLIGDSEDDAADEPDGLEERDA